MSMLPHQIVHKIPKKSQKARRHTMPVISVDLDVATPRRNFPFKMSFIFPTFPEEFDSLRYKT